MDAVCSGRKDLYLRAFLPAVVNKRLGVLKILVLVDRLTMQASLVERRTIGSRDDPDLSLRDDRARRDGDVEQVRMDRPFSRRQRAKLDALNTALFNKGDRVLEVVVSILCAIGCKNAA